MTPYDENLMAMDHVPKNVIEAANLLERWTEEHGYTKWCLSGVCSRSYE